MQRPDKHDITSKKKAIDIESEHFERYYLWLRDHMPDGFFEEIEPKQYMLIAHYLMGFPLQDYFCKIELKDTAFVLALDSHDVDMRILRNFHLHGIKNYQTFLSDAPPPFPNMEVRLRIAVIHFTTFTEKTENNAAQYEQILPLEKRRQIYNQLIQLHPEITEKKFEKLLHTMDPFFVRLLSPERLLLALSMFFSGKNARLLPI